MVKSSRLRAWARRLLLLLLVAAAGLTAAGLWLGRDPTPGFSLRRGAIESVRAEGSREEGRHRTELVEVISTSGLRAHLAIKQEIGPAEPRPLVLLMGGQDEGRDAVELIPETGGVILCVLSYPYEQERSLKGLIEHMRAVPALRRGIADTVPAIMLALDYMLTRPDVDPQRVDLVGVSLGSPFVGVAGACDPRFGRVWSIYGGGDSYALLEFGLRRELGSRLLSVPAAALVNLLSHGRSLSPERHVGRIAPREFVMLNAEDDERIPRHCVDALWEAAREPKELRWLPGEHLHPDRPELIQPLVDIVLERVLDEG